MGFAGYARYWQGIKYRRRGGSPGDAPPSGWTTQRWVLLRGNPAAGQAGAIVLPLRLSGIQAGKADGTDIRVEDGAGNQLAHRLDTYDDATGELSLWCAVGARDWRQPLLLKVAYGNANAGDQQAAASTVFGSCTAAWDCSTGQDLGPNGLHLTVSGGTVADIGGWKARSFNGTSDVLTRDAAFLSGISDWTIIAIVQAADTGWGDRGILGQGPIGSGNNPDNPAAFGLTHRSSSGSWLVHAKSDTTNFIGEWRFSAPTSPHTSPFVLAPGCVNGANPDFVIDGEESNGSSAGADSGLVTPTSDPFRIGIAARDYWNGKIGTVLLFDNYLPVELRRMIAGCLLADDYWIAVGPAETVSSGWKPIACRSKGSVAQGATLDIDVVDPDVAADPDGNAVSLTGAGTPPDGSASIVSGKLRYDATGAAVGSKSWNVTISDGAQTNTAPVGIEVTAGGGSSQEYPAPLRTINVSTRAELDSALAAAQPGDHVVMAAGSYGTTRVAVPCQGTQSAPVVIRAANALDVWWPGFDFDAASRDVILWGIDLKDAESVLRGTRNIVRRCRIWPPFKASGNSTGIHCRKGSDCRIDYCEIRLYTTSELGGGTPWNTAVYTGIWGNYWGTAFADGDVMKNLVIERCLFTGGPHDVPYSRPNAQFVEAQGDYAKTSQQANWLHWTIRLCYGEVPRDRTLIDFKAGRMILDRVHITSPGDIQLRDGCCHRLDRCRFDGGARIAVTRHDHDIWNSAVDTIQILAGNGAWSDPDPNLHAAARNVHLANTSATTLKIGHQYDSSYTYPADLTLVENHSGGIGYGNHTNTTIRGSSSVPVEAPVLLSAAEVGPNAPWVGVEP